MKALSHGFFALPHGFYPLLIPHDIFVPPPCFFLQIPSLIERIPHDFKHAYEIAEKMNVGVAHGALAHLDKHIDEQVLQRISKPVIEACFKVDTIVRTDIPELRRPWFVRITVM